MRTSRSFLFALSLSLLAGRASADDASAAEHQAAARFQEGKAAMKAGHPEEARLSFQQAYAIDPEVGTLWNLASVEMDTHHLLDALRHFREFKSDPRASMPKFRAYLPQAQQRIQTLMSQTAHFTIEGVEPGLVTLDETPLLTASHDGAVYDVLPGHHLLTAKIGGGPQSSEQDLQAGVTIPVTFAPPPQAVPAPIVAAPPSATTPPLRADAPEAEHTSHTRLWLTVGFGAAAVAALGVGIGFGVSASNEKDTINGLQTTNGCARGCDTLTRDASSERDHAHVATGMYVGSAVLGVAAVGVFTSLFVAPEKHASEQAALSPLFLSGGGGLAVDGHF